MNSKFLLNLVVLGFAASAFVWARTQSRGGGEQDLPPAVLRILRATHPDAQVSDFEHESVSVVVYEIELRENDRSFEVVIAHDGTILSGEVMVLSDSSLTDDAGLEGDGAAGDGQD